MDDRQREAYEDTLDHLVGWLWAKSNESRKEAERRANGCLSEKDTLILSEKRNKARNERMARLARAEAKAYEDARKVVEALLADGPKLPLTSVELQEFENLVFKAYARRANSMFPFLTTETEETNAVRAAFERMSKFQRRQAWTFVTGREPPPKETFEQNGFLSQVLGKLIPGA